MLISKTTGYVLVMNSLTEYSTNNSMKNGWSTSICLVAGIHIEHFEGQFNH